MLALYLQDIKFTKEFIQHCGSTIEMLKSLAKDCGTGNGRFYWDLNVIASNKFYDNLKTLSGECKRLLYSTAPRAHYLSPH